MMSDSEFKGYKKLAALVVAEQIEEWDETVNSLYFNQREVKKRIKDGNKYELDDCMRRLRSHLLQLDRLSGFFVGDHMILYSEACGFPDGSVILTEREKKHKEILKWAVTEVKKYFGYIYSEKELENVDCQDKKS